MNEATRKIVFIISGILTLTGAVLYLSPLVWEAIPYIYAIGTAGIAVIYLTGDLKNKDTRIRRLNLFLAIAGILLVLSSYFMFHHRQEWIICVLLSAVFQLYAVFSYPKSSD
ncbi:MAG: hypothetical protein LUG18_07770 [Candidatus Azobacteroides sp.]|nr:hypothetical protein [Candidatus Azobacteroides sp.]